MPALAGKLGEAIMRVSEDALCAVGGTTVLQELTKSGVDTAQLCGISQTIVVRGLTGRLLHSSSGVLALASLMKNMVSCV